MKRIFKSTLLTILLGLFASSAMADASLDALLAKIDADIIAKRLSNPAGNNAIDRIWQFKSLAPYDQRINSRAYNVGSTYVSLANRSISAKKYSKAQGYLDKVWMLAYLTPGLESSQDTLDKLYKGSKSRIAAAPKKTKAKKTAVAKTSNKKSAAQKAKEIAKVKAAKAKADKLALERRRLTEQKERKLAKLRKEEETKRQAASKLATLKAQRERAIAAVKNAREISESIADFDLNQDLIDNRETRNIRTALAPICQEILDNEASIVLHTRSLQDYRWLTVRLTLCVRRLDKGFRLRHSHQIMADNEPSISLHPGRNVSLLQKTR